MFIVRAVQPTDEPFLWEMGWEAAAVDAGMRALGREAVLAHPLIRRYLEGWGQSGDAGVLAVTESGHPLGAAFYRLFPADEPAWGFVADDIPELAIGVSPDARGRGIGSALIDALLSMARKQGYRALSLSVDRANPALRLYERHGFRDAGVSQSTDTSVTMIAYI